MGRRRRRKHSVYNMYREHYGQTVRTMGRRRRRRIGEGG
jgi:hypothetical protein